MIWMGGHCASCFGGGHRLFQNTAPLWNLDHCPHDLAAMAIVPAALAEGIDFLEYSPAAQLRPLPS